VSAWSVVGGLAAVSAGLAGAGADEAVATGGAEGVVVGALKGDGFGSTMTFGAAGEATRILSFATGTAAATALPVDTLRLDAPVALGAFAAAARSRLSSSGSAGSVEVLAVAGIAVASAAALAVDPAAGAGPLMERRARTAMAPAATATSATIP
jgi:hypothetical protein